MREEGGVELRARDGLVGRNWIGRHRIIQGGGGLPEVFPHRTQLVLVYEGRDYHDTVVEYKVGDSNNRKKWEVSLDHGRSDALVELGKERIDIGEQIDILLLQWEVVPIIDTE